MQELFVFQRTPSSLDVRDQRPTTDKERQEWTAAVKAGKRPFAERRERFAKISSGRSALRANDAYLSGKTNEFRDVDAGGADRTGPRKKLTSEEMMAKQLDTNFRIMEQLRQRVDAVVQDPETAAALKAYYPYGCKRPCFHDQFLKLFNLPHVHLVDTAPTGVQNIGPRGPVHNGKEYAVDVLIYATGYEFFSTGTFNKIAGLNGRVLSEKWKDAGTRTFLGLQSHGFPNLFIISGPQGGGGAGFNFTEGLVAHGDYIVRMLTLMRDRGVTAVDVHERDEDAWAEHCAECDVATAAFRDCLSYYNGDGTAAPGSLAYCGAPSQWWKAVDEAFGTLDPSVFTTEPAFRSKL